MTTIWIDKIDYIPYRLENEPNLPLYICVTVEENQSY